MTDTTPTDTAEGGSPAPRSPRSDRTRDILIGVALVVVVLLAVGALFYFTRPGRDLTPEQQAAERSRESQPAVTASPGPVATVTLGGAPAVTSDWYAAYFTDPKYPDNRANHQGGLDARLVALIDTARTTLDVADYDFDLANVAGAMARAKGRGVQVRFVTDSDTLNNTKNAEIQAALGQLKAAGIPIVDDQRPDIMHNKFTVVDGEWISTGSWNYTDGDTYRLNNNMIVMRSRELAANYTAEFEKMFVQRKFGPAKPKGVPNPVVTVGGVRVQNYFAPEDGVAAKIVYTVSTARRSINFLAFSFTHDGIGQAMLARAQAGVTLAGVFETTGSNTPFSEYGKFKAQGISVYQDGNPWVMHHKVIVVDDSTVIFGSFNFSESADKSNDENLLIIDDPRLAAAFKAEYGRVLAVAQNPPARKR